jgi:hypothetical protein
MMKNFILRNTPMLPCALIGDANSISPHHFADIVFTSFSFGEPLRDLGNLSSIAEQYSSAIEIGPPIPQLRCQYLRPHGRCDPVTGRRLDSNWMFLCFAFPPLRAKTFSGVLS